MIYRNIREYNITLYNKVLNKDIVVGPGETIELPEQFASFYSNVLKPVMFEVLESKKTFVSDYEKQFMEDINLTPVKIAITDSKTEEIKETTNESITSEITEKKIEEPVPVKKGRGRPKKN